MTLLAHGAMSGHGIHVLSVLGPALLVALLALGADARAWLQKRRRPVPAPAMFVAAGLSVVAAAVHALVCPEHFHEGLLYGWFFAVATGAQLIWAGLAVFRPGRWVLVSGLAGNFAIVVLWAVTRTAGIPLGPETGEVEAVGALDVITALVEMGIVVCCAWTLTWALNGRLARQPGQLTAT